MLKKKILSHVAALVVGAGLMVWTYGDQNSAQDAADYAAKTCKVAAR